MAFFTVSRFSPILPFFTGFIALSDFTAFYDFAAFYDFTVFHRYRLLTAYLAFMPAPYTVSTIAAADSTII